MSNIWLEATLPSITNPGDPTYTNWCNNTGCALLEEYELVINGQTIDLHTSLWQDIYNELYTNDVNLNSLINKHIDLQEQPQNIIFADDVDTQTRLDAVNSSDLKEAKGAMLNFNNDDSITLGKGNADFVSYKGQVYEKVQDAGNGEYDYYPIAKVDKVFYVTEVSTPFINKPNINNKEVNEGKTRVNKSNKEGGLKCD